MLQKGLTKQSHRSASVFFFVSFFWFGAPRP